MFPLTNCWLWMFFGWPSQIPKTDPKKVPYSLSTRLGWWFQPTPLKNDGVKVSWDDDSIPNWMEIHQNSMVPNHQARDTYLRTKPSLCFARSYLSNSHSWNWTSCRVSSPDGYLARPRAILAPGSMDGREDHCVSIRLYRGLQQKKCHGLPSLMVKSSMLNCVMNLIYLILKG